MRKAITILIIYVFINTLTSCTSTVKNEEEGGNTANPPNWKVIEIEGIKLKVPSSFSIYKRQGVDSYVGAIGDNNFNISYDIGRDLEENLQNIDCSYDTIVKRKRLILNDSFTQKLYKIPEINKSYLDTINGNIATIIVPNKIGKGLTQVYILNCKTGNWISLSADNLTPFQHKIALEIFETLEL